MKKLVEEYGETLLAVIAAGMILAFVLISGILAGIGVRIDTAESGKEEYQDFQVFWELVQREKPEIVYDAQRHCYAGEIISIEEVLWGEDADKNRLEVEVKEIKDSKGVDYTQMYRREVHQIIFSKAGIYQLKVRAQDKEKRYVVKMIEIPVDNARGSL